MEKLNQVEFRERLKAIPDSAFAGHTEFANLTPEQRLAWLSEIQQFVYFCRTQRETLLQPFEEPASAVGPDKPITE